MPQLVPLEGAPIEAHVWEVGSQAIGRGSECDVIIRHPLVSRVHCRVEVDGDGAKLIDCGSRNGTFLNGRRVLGTRSLTSGDIIDVGGWKARFELGGLSDNATFAIIAGGARRKVRGTIVTIGRASTADLVIREPAMSRVHATISYAGGGFVVRDAGSTNGTFVRGQRVVTRALASGDVIAFSPEHHTAPGHPAAITDGTTSDSSLRSDAPPRTGPGDQIDVVIDGETCTLELRCVTIDDQLTQDVQLPDGDVKRPTSQALTRLLRLDSTDSDTGSLIITAPVRGKARYRGGRWVPTSDIAPATGLRLAVFATALAATLGGSVAMFSARADVLSTGDVQPGHRGQTFRDQLDDGNACAACHEPWRGVTDDACQVCHERPFAAPHQALEVACASCHREHEQPVAVGPVKVGRHRCLDCHVDAHATQLDSAPSPSLSFLNRGFSATLVHADHRALECFDCHTKAADGSVDKQVFIGCGGCHGGDHGMRDARCVTCHPFHERDDS